MLIFPNEVNFYGHLVKLDFFGDFTYFNLRPLNSPPPSNFCKKQENIFLPYFISLVILT